MSTITAVAAGPLERARMFETVGMRAAWRTLEELCVVWAVLGGEVEVVGLELDE
jgi:hypothetical protein